MYVLILLGYIITAWMSIRDFISEHPLFTTSWSYGTLISISLVSLEPVLKLTATVISVLVLLVTLGIKTMDFIIKYRKNFKNK